jgi:serine/threonine protein kinase/Flp pilus assembly protein TadD
VAVKCPKCHSENPDTLKFCGECGTQLIPSSRDIRPEVTETLQTAIQELTTGSTFAGRYQIIEELGKGGMGRVYKVFDTDIKEKVALKLLKPEIASDRETIERFSNELKYARKISHRNVCRMYDLGKAEGTHFITMEYVQGEDLKSMIRMAAGLSIGAVLSIGKQICDGLAEAHSLGVVHRDLKPQNIMIDKGGNAKIMDFGIARSIREKGITGPSVLIGTPEYMSPEQAEAKEVDYRSDIYSLGIILYEMATGRVPFEGDTALSIAMKHKGEIPKNPKQINPNIPDDLSGVILKCLEKDKAKRYQTATEVRSELEKIEKGIPTTERIIPEKKTFTSREITVKFSLRKVFVPALGVIALAVIALVILRLLPKRHTAPTPSGKPSLAILYFENISEDKGLDDWKTGLTELLITDLAQSKFINVLSGDMIYGILKKLNLLEARKYSTADLVKIADEGGANYTATGSLMKAGDKIIITLTLLKPRQGEIIRPIRVECNGEGEILPQVDELSRVIKSELNLTAQQIAGDIDKEIGTITTSSTEAYKYYSEADKYGDKADQRKAIEFYQKAVAVDPEFAAAYEGMGIAYYNLGLRAKEREFLQKAFDLRDRVSDKERYEIEAEYYGLSEKTYDKSIEAFNKMLELYPEYYVGRSDLGWTYYQIEEWDKAIEQLIIVAQRSKIEGTSPYTNLALSYNAKGLYDKAIDALEAAQKKIGDNWTFHFMLALSYYCRGRYDFALQEADKSLALDRTYYYGHWLKGIVYFCRGDLVEAQKEALEFLDKGEESRRAGGRDLLGAIAILQGKYRKAVEEFAQSIELVKTLGEKERQSAEQFSLAYVYLKSGNREKAREEAENSWQSASEAESLMMQRVSLFLQGLISVESGSLDKAQKTATELKELIDSGMNKKAIRYYYNLLGRLELKRENYIKAIELFNTALAYVPFQYSWDNEHALFIEPLAVAYYGSGNLRKSVEEYEKLVSLTAGRLFYGDIYVKAFYMLGKIAEQQGDKAKAIEYYRKFLDLWKDADPGFPEVEDAKKRLAGG